MKTKTMQKNLFVKFVEYFLSQIILQNLFEKQKLDEKNPEKVKMHP